MLLRIFQGSPVFKVFDEERHFDVPNSEVKRIDLRYAENFFSFKFSAFNFQKLPVRSILINWQVLIRTGITQQKIQPAIPMLNQGVINY
jgi:hypothetical protein